MVDRRCRESEGKAKIEGYMSISDKEAHHCVFRLECLFGGMAGHGNFYNILQCYIPMVQVCEVINLGS